MDSVKQLVRVSESFLGGGSTAAELYESVRKFVYDANLWVPGNNIRAHAKAWGEVFLTQQEDKASANMNNPFLKDWLPPRIQNLKNDYPEIT